MSIATKRGDKGQTSQVGRPRVRKSDLRVEAYSTIDELGSQMGFSRAIRDDAEVREMIKGIQKELFHVNSVITPPRPRWRQLPLTTSRTVRERDELP